MDNALKDTLAALSARLDKIDGRLDDLHEGQKAINTRLDKIDRKINWILEDRGFFNQTSEMQEQDLARAEARTKAQAETGGFGRGTPSRMAARSASD